MERNRAGRGHDGVRDWLRAGRFTGDEIISKKGDAPATLAASTPRLQGTYVLALANTWFDGPILRRRRRARRQGDGVERLAGNASPASDLRAHSRIAASQYPRHLSRWRRLLWHERPRRCLYRRGVDLQGPRPARARAMDARGRAWLGPQGPTAAPLARGRPRS